MFVHDTINSIWTWSMLVSVWRCPSWNVTEYPQQFHAFLNNKLSNIGLIYVGFSCELANFIFLGAHLKSYLLHPNKQTKSSSGLFYPYSLYVERRWCSFIMRLFFSCFIIGWKESFTVILGSDQVKSGKPSPDMYDGFFTIDDFFFFFLLSLCLP